VVLAQEESRLLGHNYIGTEHILLGLLREGEGVAAKALQGLEIDLAQMRSAVEGIVGTGGATSASHIPFTPRAKTVLEMALREALALGHNYIGTEHVLLGLVREGEGVAAIVLRNAGATTERVRDEVLRLLTGQKQEMASAGTAGPPAEAVAEVSRRHRCPGCGIDLEGRLGTKTLSATSDDGDGVVPVLLVYCRACGRSLGVLPSTGTTEATS
jgi:ATP-dependent Clp protease ATP-binding subunit ClpC